jgi:uncharacterized membrane protein (DUF485 family)
MAKKTRTPARKTYLKPVVKKKHEAGWVSTIKIGIIAMVIYLVLALVFGYAKTTPFAKLLINSTQVGMLIMVVIIFIVGLITISENTVREIKKK